MIINTLKAISDTPDEFVVANYIVLFGGRDLEWARKGPNPDGSLGEYFAKNVELESPYTQSGILYMDWEHGEGEQLDGPGAPSGDDVLGYVDWKTARKDDRGWWVERVLSRRNKYVKFLEELVRAGMIGTSSEPIQGKTAKGRDGGITVWPLKRDSLTVQPAEPRMMTDNVVIALKSLSGKLQVPQFPNAPTMAEKAHALNKNLAQLLSDTTAVLSSADRPLTNTKRQELTELLETFSGLDAVRSDLQSALTAAPIVGAKRALYELRERRSRLSRVLME